METAIRISHVSRTYNVEGGQVHALRDINLDISTGSFIALMGRSGSGKTTLINMMSGLDRPSQGEVQLFGTSLQSISQERLATFRREQIGLIFQAFALLPILSAFENVELPLRMIGMRNSRERRERALSMLALVGLERWAQHRPAEMSGGQQQRIAIARALVTRPRLLLADEPTGELDSTTGRTILTLLREIVRSEGLTLVMVTHDPTTREFADRVYEMQDGSIIQEHIAA